MRIKTAEQLRAFYKVVDECEGGVHLKSIEGDNFNLKSEFSKYVSMGRLLLDKSEELELFCDNKNDESRFLEFFREHPEILNGDYN